MECEKRSSEILSKEIEGEMRGTDFMEYESREEGKRNEVERELREKSYRTCQFIYHYII